MTKITKGLPMLLSLRGGQRPPSNDASTWPLNEGNRHAHQHTATAAGSRHVGRDNLGLSDFDILIRNGSVGGRDLSLVALADVAANEHARAAAHQDGQRHPNEHAEVAVAVVVRAVVVVHAVV